MDSKRKVKYLTKILTEVDVKGGLNTDGGIVYKQIKNYKLQIGKRGQKI